MSCSSEGFLELLLGICLNGSLLHMQTLPFCPRVHFINFLFLAFVDQRSILFTKIPCWFSFCILNDRFPTFLSELGPLKGGKKKERILVCLLGFFLIGGKLLRDLGNRLSERTKQVCRLLRLGKLHV